MADIPQPASEAYEPGDFVRIYLSEDDQDVQHHGSICEVVDVFRDDLDKLSGREMDNRQYELRQISDDETLSVTFRHSDLVPASTPK